MRYLLGLVVVTALAGFVRSVPEDEHEDHDEHHHHDHGDEHDHHHDHGHDHHDHGDEFSPEKIEAQARADFDQMDTGKDGFLTKEEIQEYLNDPSADAEIDDFLSKADTDKDGKVSFAEYYQFVSDMYAEYQRQMEEAMGGAGDFGDMDEMLSSLQNGEGWGGEDDWGDHEEAHDGEEL